MNKNERSRSEDLLKICGTLMIAFGVIGILMGGLLLAALLGLGYLTGGIFRANLHTAGAAALLAASLVELIAGIAGVKAVKKGRRGLACVILGALCLVLTAASVVLNLRDLPLRMLFGLCLGVVVPAVYLCAALALRKQPAAAEEQEEAPADE